MDCEGLPDTSFGPSIRVLLGMLSVALMVVTGVFLVWLHWLEHVPYDPPNDMSSLLGAPELAIVRGLEWIFISVFAIAAFCLLGSLFFRRSDPA